METATSVRKRACPFADRSDGDRGGSNNNNSTDSDGGGDSTRFRVVEASGSDGRYSAVVSVVCVGNCWRIALTALCRSGARPD